MADTKIIFENYFFSIRNIVYDWTIVDQVIELFTNQATEVQTRCSIVDGQIISQWAEFLIVIRVIFQNCIKLFLIHIDEGYHIFSSSAILFG